MNRIINFVLKNKFAVWIMTLVIIVAGLYSGLSMKQEQMPNITFPMVGVTTIYPGATPEQVAEKVTIPVEQAVQNISGVKLVMSSSYQNASSVQLQFDYDKDMDKAEKEVGDVLAKVALPEGVETPTAQRFNFDQIPILVYGINSEQLGLPKLTDIVSKRVVPALEGIEGVQEAQVAGQQVEEVQVVFNQKKLKQLGLTEETVQQMIQGAKAKVPLGILELDDSEKSVVVDGHVTTITDLKNIEIPVIPQSAVGVDANATAGSQQTFTASTNGAESAASNAEDAQLLTTATGIPTVKLGDLATVKVIGKASSIARTNGKEAISLAIMKTSDANTVEIADKVAEKVKDFEKKNKGVNFSLVMDYAAPVKDSVNTMLSKAILGALFAVVIIWLFLRSVKPTLIAIVSIPLSLLIAILCLHQMDISLNMMTLGAMTVAIGRVIDDSIVVIENIFRRMSLSSEKLSGKELIREATKEMFKPILSSTLVTIAVFLPLGFVTGMVGEVFMPFALAIVFSLLASLLIAITIVPMLTHTLFKNGVRAKHLHEEGKAGKLTLKYKSLLTWTLNHKWITSLVTIAMLVGSLILIPFIGATFMSQEEEKMIYLLFKPNPGVTTENADKTVQKIEDYFLKKKNVSSVQISAGGENSFDPGNNKSTTLMVQYKKDSKNFTEEKEAVLKKLQKDKSVGTWSEPDWGQGGTSNVITYYVYGEKMSDLPATVKKVEAIMKKNKDVKKVESSINEAYDEYTLVVDKEKASKLGLTAGQIGMSLYPNAQRSVLTTIEKDGEELNVYVEEKKDAFNSIQDITNKTVVSPLGVPVKVGDVTEVKEGKTSDTVSRRDGRVYVAVNATPKTQNTSGISSEIKEKIDKIKLPNNVTIEQGGVDADMMEMMQQLGLAMVAAIAVVYLILVITFGGALAPFAILFSLPLTVIGALIGLFVSGELIEVTSMIGLLMLIGIVVTNAIVLIDRVIHKEAEGLTTREALLEAGGTRLRPILMTAIATIGALIPLALGFENSGMVSKGLAVTVIGGLTSSTVLTLVIVPIVYEALSKLRRKKQVVETQSNQLAS